MKREGMPTQRLEEKRVEERVGEGERERGREREREKARARRRERERKRESEQESERERERACLGHSFYMFSSTWAYPMQIGLSQECCLFYLKSSLWSSDLPLTFLVV